MKNRNKPENITKTLYDRVSFALARDGCGIRVRSSPTQFASCVPSPRFFCSAQSRVRFLPLLLFVPSHLSRPCISLNPYRDGKSDSGVQIYHTHVQRHMYINAYTYLHTHPHAHRIGHLQRNIFIHSSLYSPPSL